MRYLKCLLGIVLVSLFLSGCGVTPQAAAVPDGATSQLRRVQVRPTEQKDLDQLVVVTGTLAADQEIVLGFKVPGRLAEIPVDLGTAVQKGGPIAKLDTT